MKSKQGTGISFCRADATYEAEAPLLVVILLSRFRGAKYEIGARARSAMFKGGKRHKSYGARISASAVVLGRALDKSGRF